jgi:hypothetical protein
LGRFCARAVDDEERTVFSAIIQDGSASVSVSFWSAQNMYDSFQLGDSIEISAPKITPKRVESNYPSGGSVDIELSVDGQRNTSSVQLCKALAVVPQSKRVPLSSVRPTGQLDGTSVLVVVGAVNAVQHVGKHKEKLKVSVCESARVRLMRSSLSVM